MRYAVFAVAIPMYVFAIYLGIREYVKVANHLYQRIHLPLARTVMLYIWFLGCVAVILPFTFFFPAWLSESLNIFPRKPTTTALLILFGGAAFALSGGLAWRGPAVRKYFEEVQGHSEA